jgi:hypothetical protein
MAKTSPFNSTPTFQLHTKLITSDDTRAALTNEVLTRLMGIARHFPFALADGMQRQIARATDPGKAAALHAEAQHLGRVLNNV